MSESNVARKPTKRPPAPRRRQDRSARSRTAILAAAERLLAGSGLDGARTEGIAAEAGVNKALLYYYFKSKDALYEAVLENQVREFYERATEILDSGGRPRDVVLAYVGMHF